MSFTVYILHSITTDRFYIGQTISLKDRLDRHNSRNVPSTKNGIPWKLIWSAEKPTRSEAVKLENRIKGRGAKRFIKDLEGKS